jgi:hypothetical protein
MRGRNTPGHGREHADAQTIRHADKPSSALRFLTRIRPYAGSALVGLLLRATRDPVQPLGMSPDLLSLLAFRKGGLVLFAVGGGGFLVRAVLWVCVIGHHR